MPPFLPLRFLTHSFIVVMVVVSLAGFGLPRLIELFGWHPVGAPIPQIIGQLFLFQFLHGDLLHLAMNGLFIYQAGPEVESRMTRARFWIFFLSSTIFVATALTIFSPNTITIGMSGFCMALLSYLWIDLQTTRHPMANQILIMLALNILIGFSASISMTAHVSGALWGAVLWYVRSRIR